MNETKDVNQQEFNRIPILLREDSGTHEYTLDEAIQATKIGKYQMMLIFLTGFSIMGVSLENVSISYVLSYVECDLNFTTTQKGVLASVSFLGVVSTSYVWGFLVDTMGRQKVMSISAFCGFSFSFASAFSPNFHALVLFRFLAGAMLAGSQAAAYSYVSEFHTNKLAPRAVAYATMPQNGLHIFMAIPAMLIMPMNWNWHIFNINFNPWRLYLIFNSFVNLFNGIVFTFMLESPKFLLVTNQKAKALDVLRRVYAFNTGQPKENYPVNNIKIDVIGSMLSDTHGFCNIMRLLWSQTKPIFLPPLRTHTWKVCYIIFVMFALGHGTFMWFPNFLVQLQNYDGPLKSLCDIVQPKNESIAHRCENLDNKNILSYKIMLGAGVFLFATGGLGSYLLKKISPKKILTCWLLISSVTCVTLNIFIEFNLIVMSFIIFLSIVSGVTIALAVAVNLFPTNYRGMATSFILMFGRIGGFSGGTLIGILLAKTCSTIFYLYGALLIGSIFIFMSIRTTNSTNK